jgi:DeoR family transcriptional regulator, aga operon transcriptional repressor
MTIEHRPTAGRLLIGERRRHILALVEQQQRVTVAELCGRFGVSAVTARADLDALAQEGQLVRSHGGGIARLPQPDLPIGIKATLHHEEKVKIGRAAAKLVADGDTIILDSGTTTVEIARSLKSRPYASLTVITNALNVASELAEQPRIRVIVIGGILRQPSHSLVGPHAEHALTGLRADRLFLGVDGFDPDVGMTTPDVLEAQLNALMIRVARETTVVADASKFGRRSLSIIGTIDMIHRVITDDRADASVVSALSARNIEVVIT